MELAKKIHPELPFIIVSGEIDLKLVVSLMKDGAQDYIQKTELPRLAPAIECELREAEIHRENQQDALENSETRYRRLFETTQDGILILDADKGQIQDVNPFLMEMLGYSKKEFLGKKLWEVRAFKDTEASKIAFGELQSKGYVRYEDLTWAQLGLHTKPCGLINVDGYFDLLLSFLDHAVSKGFMKQEQRDRLLVSNSPEDILRQMETYRAPKVEKWMEVKTRTQDQSSR